jgi:hypothetical protein
MPRRKLGQLLEWQLRSECRHSAQVGDLTLWSINPSFATSIDEDSGGMDVKPKCLDCAYPICAQH